MSINYLVCLHVKHKIFNEKDLISSEIRSEICFFPVYLHQLVPMRFHLAYQLELCACTVKIVALAVYGEILIAVYVVGEEPHAALKRHYKRAERQHIALPLGKARAGFGKAAREHAVQVQIEPHALQLLLILRRGGRAEAYRIAEIVGRQPRGAY